PRSPDGQLAEVEADIPNDPGEAPELGLEALRGQVGPVELDLGAALRPPHVGAEDPLQLIARLEVDVGGVEDGVPLDVDLLAFAGVSAEPGREVRARPTACLEEGIDTAPRLDRKSTRLNSSHT